MRKHILATGLLLFMWGTSRWTLATQQNENKDSSLDVTYSTINENFTYALPVTQFPSSQPPVTCRYRYGYTDLLTYKYTTCAHCYLYQFPTAPLKAYGIYLVSLNGTIFPNVTYTAPDITNKTIVDRICGTLAHSSYCNQWLQCCTAAEQCCAEQNQLAVDPHSTSCPSTWDGYGCWAAAEAGAVLRQSCPGYIPAALPGRYAYKTCTENGTWFYNANMEWTDYTKCLSYDYYYVGFSLKVGGSVASVLVLIPSIAIFLSYRSLRKQNRIRIHINFFSSFTVFSLVTIMWQVFVSYDRIDNAGEGSTVVAANSVGCRFANFMTRYLSACNYVWMFCEGLYLHRLIVKAFQPPKRLYVFYIIGWGFPLLPTLAYAIMRLYKKNDNCWLHNVPHYEWILYGPNLLTLVVNLGFLCNILRILLTQIQSHPNEPSNYRRAIKATFMLVPLFGLQLFFTLYRPGTTASADPVLDIVTAIITHTQGFVVALVLCLTNGEVLSHLKRSCRRFGLCKVRTDPGNMYTVETDVYTRESPTSSFRVTDHRNSVTASKEYIEMKPMAGNNGYAM